MIEKGVATQKVNRRKEAIAKLLKGKDVVLKHENVQQIIYQQPLDKIGVHWGDTVTIKCEINTVDAHPNAYAVDARQDDPAKRLGISMTARDGQFTWIKGNGENKVFRANSLVDEMEGVQEAVSRASERRYFPTCG
ncbi:MAG: hypothetical protein Q9183_007249 [Haloplaca sp. 2 TL-2023]